MMNIEKFQYYAKLYKDCLLKDVVPFWENNSIDWDDGGYYTSLTKEGEIYDTDKFTWLQARQIWTFSMLYNNVEQKEEWLKIATNGIEFLKKHGRDEDGSFYFSLTKKGEPLTQAFNIYSDCFGALAFGEYAKATGDKESLDIAKTTYKRFIYRKENPKGKFEKSTGIRPLRSFGLSMMTAYLSRQLGSIVSREDQQELFDGCIDQILNVHYNPKTKVIHENVSSDGPFIDTYEGRLINPGHGIEAMWFLLDIAVQLDRPELITKIADICIKLLEYGWDKEYGGIYYFMDAKGAPLQQLEWDQKLWWVHQETLIALSRIFLHTKRSDVWEWYEKVHQYSWKHFPDPENGEWYGYLNRRGVPHTTLKGGKWKGCFHTPRAMYECWQTFEKLTKQDL